MFIFSEHLRNLAGEVSYSMKNIFVLLVLFSLKLNAQNMIEPKFEREGELIKVVLYYDNGEVEQTGFFKDKKRHGNWISYDSFGRKSAMGTYQDGLKSGQWFFWNQDDLIEVIYEENEIVSVLKWNNSEKKLIAKNN